MNDIVASSSVSLGLVPTPAVGAWWPGLVSHTAECSLLFSAQHMSTPVEVNEGARGMNESLCIFSVYRHFVTKWGLWVAIAEGEPFCLICNQGP